MTGAIAFSPDDVPRLPRGVRLKADTVRGTTMLLAPERAFALNGIAVRVLGLVDGVRTVQDIVASLAAQFSADEAVIQRDVVALLGDLAEKRVIER